MKNFNDKGQIIVQVMVFGMTAIFIITAFSSLAAINIKVARQTLNRELAFQIAEAGVDYYRWHLAHSPQDYYDGTGNPGTYVHNFYDKNNNIIGQFILNITPPSSGSSLVTILSTGKVNADPNISRKIMTKLAKPSLAKYAVVANDVMRFGQGTEVFGPIHSNNGIRFDGIAHNIVSSSAAEYNDPDHTGANEFGVHTHLSPVDPYPPNPAPQRPDVFQAGRQFPVPAADFVGITVDIGKMKTDSQTTNGFYRSGSGELGYHIVLKTNDTFDLYVVTSLTNPPSGCLSSETGWKTWSIRISPSGQTLLGNYAFPSNGIIFLEDDVFVDGQINTARLTIVAAYLPDSSSTRKNIIINKNLLYTYYDGQDAIGLIAQNNINVGLMSEDDLHIDGALIAQNGRVGRYFYNTSCGVNYHRSTITLFGMIGTSQRYGFSYVGSNNWNCGGSIGYIASGYCTRNLNYDANFLYGPPPNFPLTTENYETLSWEEVE